MGNDGGSIPTRRELVKESARALNLSEIRANTLESQTHAWNVCPVSDQPLDPESTVSDARGRLYAYEAILQCLMPAATADDKALPESQLQNFSTTGIKGLKDVVRLKFHVRPGKSAEDAASAAAAAREMRACPISMKELGPATKSVYLVPCGHVFAEAAMKEILPSSAASTTPAATTNCEDPAKAKDSDNKEQECPECSTSFLTPRDIIPILPVDQGDIDRLALRSEILQGLGLAHNLKKDKSGKSSKKRKAVTESENGEKEKKLKKKEGGTGIESRINNSATASLTARVLAEEEARKKRTRLAAAGGR